MSEKLSFPGEVDFDQLDIITQSGKRFDARGIVADFCLFEDIFSNTMSGYMILQDSNNLIDELPLIGEELLEIELKTPTLERKIKKQFYIYKCSDRKKLKKRMDIYTLHFCSIELIASSNTKVSKAFSGNITDTVAQIFSDPKMIGSKQKLFVNRTKNSYKFIPAFWTPIETINWLSLRAIDEIDAPNYLFYETSQSFEFCSLNELLSYKSERTYEYSDVDSNTVYGVNGDKENKYKIIESMESDVVFDYLRSLKSGMYAGKLYTYDLTTKDIKSNTFDYIESFEEYFHTQGDANPVQTEKLFRKKNATQYFIEKNNYLHGSFKPQGYSDFFLQRISLLQQISNFKLMIEVFGRTDIKAGNMIELIIPDAKDVSKSELLTKEIANNNISGNYLITAIRHSVINGHHKMLMEVVLDSFVKKINTKIS